MHEEAFEEQEMLGQIHSLRVSRWSKRLESLTDEMLGDLVAEDDIFPKKGGPKGARESSIFFK